MFFTKSHRHDATQVRLEIRPTEQQDITIEFSLLVDETLFSWHLTSEMCDSRWFIGDTTSCPALVVPSY